MAQTLTMIAFSFVFPFFPLYVQALGVRGVAEAAQWAGVLAAASAIAMTIAQPIWGSMADRHGRRPMVLRSMLGGGIVVGAMGFVTSPEQLLVLRVIQGLVTGTVAACNALVAASTPRARLGFSLGIMQMGVFVGASLGPLIGGVIADRWGFQASFCTAGLLLLVGGTVAWIFVEEQFTPPPKGAQQPSVWRDSKRVLGIAALPALLAVTFLIQFGQSIIAPILSLFVSELSGGENPATTAGVILAGTGFMSAVSALTLGRLSDRIGHTLILSVCLAGATLSFIPQAFVQDVGQLFLLRLILGLFIGGLMPTANALIAGLVPREHRGAAFGLTSASNSFAHGAGPLAGAGLATQWGMRSVFVATGFLFAIGYLWTTFGLRRHAGSVARATAREVPPSSATSPPDSPSL